MYEGCLSTVPLIYNQTINVTHLVGIWAAIQSGILNRLLQRQRTELPNERVSDFNNFFGLAQNESYWCRSVSLHTYWHSA